MQRLENITTLAHKKPFTTLVTLVLIAIIGLLWNLAPSLPEPPSVSTTPPCSMQSQPQRPACGAFLISEPKEEENSLKSLENIIAMAHEKPDLTITILLLVILSGLVWLGLPLLSMT
ncbi:hypothetical protein KW830_05860 [Comamonas sp. CMM03]|uniref:hypothetical protein n=1 Tax=Comamonas sp. CMM03 TaxID=2854781 RepID=UPI001C46F8D8|nr:hypothetical protein [Comamonas sp. CMM03]MBV7417979.1 hypothetical protein [Comamonas sp. CMM03]